MASLVKLKRSSVAGKIPAIADLDLGELAINTHDGKLFLKKNDGTDSIVEVGSSGGSSVIVSITAPIGPSEGDLWWNSEEGNLKVYYNDGTSSQWVDAFSISTATLNNIRLDGGFSASVYTADQIVNGGTASG